MGDETLYATKGYTSIIRWADPSINLDSYIIQRTIDQGSDTMVAGDIVSGSGETQGLVDKCTESETSWLGICMGPVLAVDGYDLDDAIADGTTINVLRPTGGRTIVSVIMNSSATTTADLDEGDFVRVADLGGHVELFVWADSADSTDTCELIVGRAAEVIENSTADDRVIGIWY